MHYKTNGAEISLSFIMRICKSLENMHCLKEIKKEIKFIIRIRPVKNEISKSYLMRAQMEFSDFVNSTNREFDELSNIDCLLALSSTTLEQAINNNIQL